MIVAYNFLAVILIALVAKLGINYTDYEEFFVALGVVDVVYLVCVLGYMLVG